MKKLSEIRTFNEPTDWEAPEGGWGWVAALGLSLLFIVTVAPDGCFGLIFDDFIEEHQAGTTFVTAVVSVCLCSGSALGLITNFALSKFSCRQVGVTGSIVYFCGSFFSAFATSTYHLLFTYGVLQGIGLGLMVPAVFTSFNHYFIRKRTFVMGITQLIIAIVSIVVPLIIQNLLIHYGYRGTQLIISAFSLNALLSMVVQQPVKKHMRRRQVDVETKAAAAELLSPKAIPITEGTEKVWYFDANNGGVVEVQEVSKEEGAMNKCWGAVVNFLDLRLLLDPVYVNIAVGVAVSSVTLIHFFAFHPILILSLGFSKDETALCIAIGNATDLAGRLCVALIGYGFPEVSSRLLYLLGVATTVIGRIIFVSFNEFIAVAIMTGFLGFFRSFVNVPLPLVFAEYNLDRFPSAFGLYSVMFGITAVMVGPLIGWIRDATNSYPNCVFALDALALFACVIPWTVELTIKRFFSTEKKS